MPLSRHINQGRLLYFTQDPDAISVCENNYLRWLSFDDVVQSVIRKAKPYQLTLPHQWALMMPLLNCTPSTVVELGLGGGNHLQFSRWLSKDIDHQVIEANDKVIALALEYFYLSSMAQYIHHQNAECWLTQQPAINCDWLVFDIYQKVKFGDFSYNQLLNQVIEQVPNGSILSINFPETTEKEISYWLSQLLNKHSHIVHSYTVPHYQNIVLHLLPKTPAKTIVRSSILPTRLQRFWQQYHLRFGVIT
ncbi:hypothetical protein [Colwellia sp. MEBiC06753]